jgi:nitric oxide dioxygenase
MTPDQIKLIQSSFGAVLPIADEAATLFYDRLFALDPSLRPLFRGDMREQGRKLMATLRVVVEGLERLDQLVPAVRALGQRHAAYGVREAHYATVGSALLWTLEQGLGPAFTPSLQAAWSEAYAVLAGTMIAAAQAQPAPVAAGRRD